MFMRRLLSYIKDYKWKAVLAPLFKCLEALVDLFVPVVIARMIDRGIATGDMGYVLRMGGLLLILAAVGLCYSFTAQYFAATVAVKTGKAIRKDLFHHINTFSHHEMDEIGTSTLITRMTSDINAVESGINMALRLFMRSPFIVFGALIMAFMISAKEAVVFCVTIPLLAVVVYGIMLVTMPMYKNVQRQLDGVMKTARENLLGVRVVRAFNRQDSEKEEFKQENDLLTTLQVKVGRISALLNPVTYVMINLAIVVLIQQGAFFVYSGSLTRGNIVALINYMSQILVELIKLANLIIQITRAMASMDRINAVFAIEASVKNVIQENATQVSFVKNEMPENAMMASAVKNGMSETMPWTASEGVVGDTIVEFKNVSFGYTEGAEPALRNLSFSIKRGDTVGIIGGTGAGKTSLISLIPRFYDVTDGAVSVFGKDVKEQDPEELRRHIGLVPQKAVLFRGTLRDNMCWGKPDAKDPEIWDALKTAQAYDFVKEKGEGLDLPVEQGGRNFSGGQKQRLTIARSLVRQPEILILDDSASALDFATDAALRKAIREQTGQRTVFLVSQRVSTVRQADLIIVLDEGQIAGIGKHEELVDHCEVYREICLSQLSEKEVKGNVEG